MGVDDRVFNIVIELLIQSYQQQSAKHLKNETIHSDFQL